MIQQVRLIPELFKQRLTSLVVLMAMAGYGIAAIGGTFSWSAFLALTFGSYLITGAANTINQIAEVEYDKIMVRTQSRPLPTNRLTKKQAWIIIAISVVIGSALLWFFTTPLCLFLSLTSLILYAYVYTPMKRISPISVFIGAIPGGLPPLLGYVAYTGKIDLMALVLFGVQFFWQFPHFWAIAWLSYEDYIKAGYKMLPSLSGKGTLSAVYIVIYTVLLIPVSLLPTAMQLTGRTSAVIAFICGLYLVYTTIHLLKFQTNQAAKKVLFTCFGYLPIVLVSYLFDKI